MNGNEIERAVNFIRTLSSRVTLSENVHFFSFIGMEWIVEDMTANLDHDDIQMT